MTGYTKGPWELKETHAGDRGFEALILMHPDPGGPIGGYRAGAWLK